MQTAVSLSAGNGAASGRENLQQKQSQKEGIFPEDTGILGFYFFPPFSFHYLHYVNT